MTNQHLLLSAIIIGWRDVLGELTNVTHEHETGFPRISCIIKSKYNYYSKAEDNSIPTSSSLGFSASFELFTGYGQHSGSVACNNIPLIVVLNNNRGVEVPVVI